ncbi:MAG: hypothetical protein AAGJ73_10650 [Pseudomonadota bacterium]
MTAQTPIKKPRRAGAASAKNPAQAPEKFAALNASLLDRDTGQTINRKDAIVYSQSAAEASVKASDYPRIAVTFRMEKNEFARLRKGAQMIGVKPRDVVHRAIKNCLDAYGVNERK